VLEPEILIGQRTKEQESAGSRFFELVSKDLTIDPAREGYGGH
jgi:hypothetical protein